MNTGIIIGIVILLVIILGTGAYFLLSDNTTTPAVVQTPTATQQTLTATTPTPTTPVATTPTAATQTPTTSTATPTTVELQPVQIDPVPSTYYASSNSNWGGVDLGSVNASSVSACGATCATTYGCVLFTYGAGGKCTLKQLKPVGGGGSTSVRRPDGTSYMNFPGLDMPNFDIKKITAADIYACNDACTADGSCAATMFYSGSGDCYLKKPAYESGTTTGWMIK